MPFSNRNTYMRRSTRGASQAILLIGLLCGCVTLQILGAPISLWDLDGSSELVETSSLNCVFLTYSDFKLALFPICQFRFSCDTPYSAHDLALQKLVFHPPPPIV